MLERIGRVDEVLGTDIIQVIDDNAPDIDI
jgi:hypothetical protein